MISAVTTPTLREERPVLQCWMISCKDSDQWSVTACCSRQANRNSRVNTSKLCHSRNRARSNASLFHAVNIYAYTSPVFISPAICWHSLDQTTPTDHPITPHLRRISPVPRTLYCRRDTCSLRPDIPRGGRLNEINRRRRSWSTPEIIGDAHLQAHLITV